MEKTISIELPADEAAKLTALMEMCIARMDEAHEQMAKDQVEIERLRADTRAVLERMERRHQCGSNLAI
ncbi:MAG: hypothetical protein HOP19_04505 [Acidobacteria bacterium]|nr:hypothetical protein [Acidobacteriota bacterium]